MSDIDAEDLMVTTRSEAETTALGVSLGRDLAGGTCVAVTGSLGAGKSVLVRGICAGLGVDEEVLSPSFILFEEYRGRVAVIHTDFYRLEHESEIEALGVFDRIGDDAVVIAEWGDRSARFMALADIVIDLSVAGGDERTIRIERREGDDA